MIDESVKSKIYELEKAATEDYDNAPYLDEYLEGYRDGLHQAAKELSTAPTIDAVPVDFINQKIVELQSCANQHFDDGNEILATCVLETIRLLGSFLKEWRGKEKR